MITDFHVFLSKGILPLEQKKSSSKLACYRTFAILSIPLPAVNYYLRLLLLAQTSWAGDPWSVPVMAVCSVVQCSVEQGHYSSVQCSALKCCARQCSAVLQQKYCTICIRPVIDLMGGQDKKQQTVFQTYWGTLDLQQRLCFASYSFSIQKIILIEICIWI